MLKFRLVYVFFSCLYVVSTEESSIKSRKERGATGVWGYDSENGPLTWGGVCQAGKKQSPINIQLGTVTLKNFPSFAFDQNYLSKQKFNAKNNGHTIYVDLENDSQRPVIYGGGLGSAFIFEQLHLHWESEHEFDGKRADLEMHVVHYNSKYESFAEASTKPDGLVVLAVIFDESVKTDSLIEDFFEYILEASKHNGHPSYPALPDNYLPDLQPEKESEFFSLRDLLPKYVSRFFRYEGSLTTPGCGEVVQWTVFINRLPVSSKVLNELRMLRDHHGNELTRNFRPPQNLNGRQVFIQLENSEDSGKKFGQLNNAGSTNNLGQLFTCCGLLLACRYN